MSAEVGLIITSVAAFRALFLAQKRNRNQGSYVKSKRWYIRTLELLRRAFISNSRSKPADPNSTEFQHKNLEHIANVPHIPGATMNGARAFVWNLISSNSRIKSHVSEFMPKKEAEDDEDYLPLSRNDQPGRSVELQHDMLSKSQRVGYDLSYSQRVGSPAKH